LSDETTTRRGADRQRWQLLVRLEHLLDGPMAALGFLWLALLVLELTRGLSPLLEHVSGAIWVVFILDFLLRFTLAPRKLVYLRRNWLTLIALVLPGLRVLRFARVLRGARGLRLVRVVTSLNRGMRALGRTMRRRGFGYVMGLTVLVNLAGAAGMYAFESLPGGEGLHGYGDALWWTSMIMTTLGSAYWPQTPEGRILGFLLSVYAIAVFGYITATLASYFIGRDAASAQGEVAGEETMRALRREIAALRAELRGGGEEGREGAPAPDD
jgi:voltage-gated potassium channel